MREVNKNMLTKKYNNGFVTLDAKKFLSVAQEAIDREVRNFEPVKTAVEKLYELECKNIPKDIVFDKGCPNCSNDTNILFGDKHCVECGQRLKWK